MSVQRFAAVLMLVLVATTPAFAGEFLEVDGQTVVRNAEPALPMVELELEELWRRGGDGPGEVRGPIDLARLACLGSGTATLGEDDTETIEVICYRLPEIQNPLTGDFGRRRREIMFSHFKSL